MSCFKRVISRDKPATPGFSLKKTPNITPEDNICRVNYLVILLEGAVFILGSSFISASILSMFVSTFSNSMDLAGLPASLMTIMSSLGQLLLGPFMPRIRFLDKFMHKIYWTRCVLFIVPLLLFLRADSMLIVIVFLVAYAFFNLMDGFALVPWTDIYARSIRPQYRGRLMGNRVILGGVASTIGGALVKWLMDSNADPNVSYGYVFLVASIIMLVTVLILQHLGDLHHLRPKNVENVGLFATYKRMLPLLKENVEFRKITISRVFITLSNMALSMTILFGSNVLGITDAQASTLIYVQILGTVLGGVIWGQLSTRFDNRMVVLASFGTGMLIPVIAIVLMLTQELLSSGLVFELMIIMTILTGMNFQSLMIGAYNYQIDVVPAVDRATSIVLTCIISLPLGLLTSLSGVIAERFGFMLLMGIVLLTSLAGYIYSLRLLKRNELATYMDAL